MRPRNEDPAELADELKRLAEDAGPEIAGVLERVGQSTGMPPVDVRGLDAWMRYVAGRYGVDQNMEPLTRRLRDEEHR